MAQETKQTQGQLPCTTGCGFYGNPRNDGMCSVCYKDFLQRQNSNGRASPQGELQHQHRHRHQGFSALIALDFSAVILAPCCNQLRCPDTQAY